VVLSGTTTANTFSTDLITEKTSAAGVTIDGVLLKDNGVVTGAGTVSAPVYSTTGDTNTGIFFPAADTIAFAEGGAEAMRIDSSGNVGIGTTTPTIPLQIYNASSSQLLVQGDSTTNIISARYSSDATAPAIIGRKFRGSVASPSAVNSSDVAGNLIFQAYGGTNNRNIALIQGAVETYTSDTNISGALLFSTNGGSTATTERMRITSAGNVGIGTSSPLAKLDVAVSSGRMFLTANGSNNAFSSVNAANNAYVAIDYLCGRQDWYYNGTFGMRLDTSGNLLVGTTATSFSSGVGVKFLASSTVPSMAYVLNTNGDANTYHLYNTNATNNGFRFYVNVNGGIYNFSGNNSNLSDFRSKTNIELSGNYLDKICSIPIKLFNYKDEPENEQRTLGVIAQDVEAVAPELVNNDGFGETPEDGVPLKSVYTTDMMFALMKSIQELKAELDTVKAELATLKGQA
jgi:hypothetical protein